MYKKPIFRTVSCIAVSACLIVSSQLATRAQTPSVSAQPSQASWKSTVMAVPADPTEPNERVTRQRRAELFNDKNGGKPRLDIPVKDNGVGYGSAPPFRVQIPPLPFSYSHTVIVGTVVGFQPHFSDDRTTIFTELQIRVESVVKAGRSLVPQQVVLVPQLGGTVKLSDGRTVTQFAPDDETTLDVGRRYLLFLSYQESFDYYGTVKAWQFRDGRAQPLGATDIRDARNGKLRLAVMPESDFMLEVARCMDSSSPYCSY